MHILLYSTIILVCFGALALGASWLVDSAARIARSLGVSPLVIGLTVVAFGSSAPEFAVTVTAAAHGNAAISIGNVIGSNIYNIGFILGGCALLIAMKTRPALVWRDGLLLLAITVLLYLFGLNHQISRLEGFVLAGLLVAYMILLFYKRQALIDEDIQADHATWKDWPMLIIGLTMIVGGGHYLVDAAENLARLLGLSQWVIAVTVVAAGTSVPEFVISLVALLKKHHGISAGNLIGSNIFNTLGVLGIASVIKPLTVDNAALTGILMLIGITVVVVIFMRTGWKISRWEGLLLVLLSVAVWVYNFSHPTTQ